MKKITGYLSNNGNIFVYFQNPKMLSPYNLIGAFLNNEGEILCIVDPYKTRFFILSWVTDAEKKEIEIQENLEETLWANVSIGTYSDQGETSTEYFTVFMIQQEDQHKLELITYKTGTNWHSYEGAVGYVSQEPFLVSKTINGELVKKEGRRKPAVRKFGFIPNPARTNEPEQWSKQDLIENFSLVEGERFIVTPYSEKENFKYALKIQSSKGGIVLGFLNENPGFSEEK